MATQKRLSAKRVEALLRAATYGIENLRDDDRVTEHEYEQVWETIRLLRQKYTQD